MSLILDWMRFPSIHYQVVSAQANLRKQVKPQRAAIAKTDEFIRQAVEIAIARWR